MFKVALKSDGSLVTWGDAYNGWLTPPEGNTYVSISAGDNHALALRAVNQQADFNTDNHIDLFDLAVIGQNWLDCGLVIQENCWQLK